MGRSKLVDYRACGVGDKNEKTTVAAILRVKQTLLKKDHLRSKIT